MKDHVMKVKLMDDKFWEDYGDIPELKASNNKMITNSGVGFIYGKPASRKTTIAIDTVKSMDGFASYLYVDMDSKSVQQAKETYKDFSTLGWDYYNSLFQNGNTTKILLILKEIPKNSCVIIDTWHQLSENENDNDYAKKVMKLLRKLALKKNLLIVLIAHNGKTTDDIRGASSVSGDATFKCLVSLEKEICTIKITKDSTGLLQDSTAIIVDSKSITDSVIKYSTEIKEEIKEMKPKETAITTTLINRVNLLLNEDKDISVGDLRNWLYDNYNSSNKLLPNDKLFCSNRFLRDNFVDFTESLFKITKVGRNKFIKGFIYEEHRVSNPI